MTTIQSVVPHLLVTIDMLFNVLSSVFDWKNKFIYTLYTNSNTHVFQILHSIVWHFEAMLVGHETDWKKQIYLKIPVIFTSLMQLNFESFIIMYIIYS
jgi:hypothetical protein